VDFSNKYGVGLIHSDELPGYGISEDEVERLRGIFNADKDDCMILVAAEGEKAEKALKAVLERAEKAMMGIPEETRKALQNGSSAYLRPLPGAARMYPETDVPPVEIEEERVNEIKNKLPETFEHRKRRYKGKYGLNEEFADKISRNIHFSLFEEIMKTCPNLPATLVAKTLTDTLAELMHEGVAIKKLDNHHFIDIFKLLSGDKALTGLAGSWGRAPPFGKEAIPDILRFLVCNPEFGVAKAIDEIGLRVNMEEVEKFIEDVVNSKKELVRENGLRSVGPLMGVVMKELRGRVDGKVVNEILKEKVEKVMLNSKLKR
jgi:glutamyl-tRNA(Gln) amidotransferase subunit E